MAQGLFNLKQVIQAVQQGGWSAQKPPAVEYLVVAGGGGGGGGYGTGGGAGGLLQGVDQVPNGQTLVVTIGAGGTGNGNAAGNNGNNSVFGQISATGGGYGVSGYGNRSNSGGSGGGSAGNTGKNLWGEGVAGQGNRGGNGGQETGSAQGGGGGAGTKGMDATGGNNGGAGGVGAASAITGTVTAYAGGGGGGTYNSTAGDQGIGGAGGGGSAGTSGGSNTGANGTANTGGGGGGCSYNSGAGGTIAGGTGGSGFVAISYPDIYAAAASTTNATVSTSGSGSISYTGSTSVYLSTATNTSSFAFAGGDFTVEFWLYINSSGSYTLYDSRALGSNDTSPTIYLNSNVLTYFTSGGDRIVGGSVLSNTTWYHVAVVRIGTNTKMYVNGTQTGSTYTDTNTYINTSGRPFIGSGSVVVGQNPLNGYLTNVRVVKGVGVYTGNFTSPTAPLQATQPAGTNIAAITSTSTSLLLNAVSGAYLADSSTFGNTFSVSTSPTWNQLSPFTGTGYKNRVYTWTTSGTITF